MKAKKKFLEFSEISYRLQDPNLTDIYAVNVKQYQELVSKEGQSFITDTGIQFMDNIRSRLKKIPNLRKPYILIL